MDFRKNKNKIKLPSDKYISRNTFLRTFNAMKLVLLTYFVRIDICLNVENILKGPSFQYFF